MIDLLLCFILYKGVGLLTTIEVPNRLPKSYEYTSPI